jgi:DNA-binding response OmpR family regulator
MNRILVVQDDPVLLGLVSGSLRPEGHEVREIADPLEALAFAAGEPETIDLLIVRVDSKPISGIELAKRLASQGVEIPILFLSDSRALAGVIATSFGRSAVLEQPFSGAELRAAARRCMAGHGRKQKQIA